MTRTRLVAVLLLVLCIGLIAPAAPAAAGPNSVCKTTATTPASAGLTVSYGAAFDCSENHPNIYVTACLWRSNSPLGGWTLVEGCETGHASGGHHVHVAATATDACVLGYYVTTAVGYNASGLHTVYDQSAPAPCLAVATN
jgi:hypothetical protein